MHSDRSDATSDRDERIAVLEGRAAFQELTAAYAWHVTRGNIPGVMSLFTEDALFEVGLRGERLTFRGKVEIQAFLSQSLRPGVAFPTVTNHMIEVSGDEAIGVCSMHARVLAAMDFGDSDAGLLGYYHDKARRVGSRWLLCERRAYSYHPVFERSENDPGAVFPAILGGGNSET